jgi:hypothetical protein
MRDVVKIVMKYKVLRSTGRFQLREYKNTKNRKARFVIAATPRLETLATIDEMAKLFDPQDNRKVSNCHYYMWKFKKLEVAEQLLFLALLKFGGI